MFNRRSFLGAAVAFPSALRTMALSVAGPKWVFLGTDKGAGIFRCTWDHVHGRLGEPELALATDRPDYFALHANRKVLYTVNSVGGGKGMVSAVKVDAATGALELLNSVSSHGDGPCYVSLDNSNRAAYVANYSGGSFAAYTIGAQGALQDVESSFDCHATGTCGPLGPVKDRQDGAHLHCAVVAPDNQFVLACDLGDDAIEVFPTPSHTKILLGTPVRVAARRGSGPRHLAFHPNGRWVYVIHELDSTVELFDWRKGKLTRRDGTAIHTTEGDPKPGDTGCEIAVSPNGRFVYTCTRGADTIEVFRVDAASGKLTLQQRIGCGGKVPRYFTFDPTNRWLLCANQNAPGVVTVFSHDPGTGKLTGPTQSLAADTPMFVQFV